MTGAASDREADPKRSAPASGQKVIWEIKAPGANGAAIGTKPFRGTRASANTSGSDFTWALGPVKLRGKGTRTERRKPVSSAGAVFERANSSFERAYASEMRSSRLT